MSTYPRLDKWRIPFETHLAETSKVIAIHKKFMDGDLPMHCTQGAWVKVTHRENFNSMRNDHREIGLMEAISRGLISFNQETGRVEWGGAVCHSIKLSKL